VTVLLTGAAGFIGFHTASALLARGEEVIGIDSLNAYYDPRLKQARLARLLDRPGFTFHHCDVADRAAMEHVAASHPGLDSIVHLAAQAGVRHSMVDPHAFIHSNVLGHLQILELARRAPRLRHLVYASSSSVYGGNTAMPFAETDRVDAPLSIYAATKRADELMSHAYAHLYGLPQTGLRFFTVYGPWGRPDMAYFSFAEAILAGTPITLYDEGTPRRDFTYIDDIVAGILGCLARPPEASAPARLLNIGNSRNESVATLIALLEASLGRRAVLCQVPRPRADVAETYADIHAIAELTGYAPTTPLSAGIPLFVSWLQGWRGTFGHEVDFGVDRISPGA